MSSQEDVLVDVPEAYEKKSWLSATMVNAGEAGAFGLVLSAARNALGKHKQGALGVFTRTGSTIGLFAAVGAAFGLTDALVANTREKKDAYNSAAAACASGLVLGASARSVPTMFYSCAALGTVIGSFDAASRSMGGALADTGFVGFNNKLQFGQGEEAQKRGAEERERRRKAFFKQPREPQAEQAEE